MNSLSQSSLFFDPIGEEAALIATLPTNATGGHIRAVRQAACLSQQRFGKLGGISRHTVKKYEISNRPLSYAHPRIRAGIAIALQKLGVRLTEGGWEKLQEPSQ